MSREPQRRGAVRSKQPSHNGGAGRITANDLGLLSDVREKLEKTSGGILGLGLANGDLLKELERRMTK